MMNQSVSYNAMNNYSANVMPMVIPQKDQPKELSAFADPSMS